ncbi:MAG: stage 0 sporulation family protein, partial [Dysosmobacter sp.]|nr:stage 0 sporulation family protein [Dysosmobacter sp.]
MTEVISVRFRGGCKNYYFNPNGNQVKMGDQVIVETAQGPEFATCTEGNHEVEDSAIVKPLSPMLRMATDSDRRTVEQNKKRESEAFDICEKKIAAHGLEMKLVNVSASFDGNKIVFYFTADGRVDFRELVRDLAGVFRARIELRQIGVRDEAKMIGGLGICGRPFCCSQFLDGFLPVSIKMAKTQNLSLNPTKISGTCGRLMCCLKYEQNVYEDAAKRMPKAESFVQTPDGPGNVKSVDLLRETVKVSLDSAPEPLKCYHNCEVCVLRNGKGSREGIAIPERPARYVEEKEEDERLESQTLTTPFYMDDRLEDAPVREKIGGPGSGESKPRRRHRGGRRRGGKSGEGAEQPSRPDSGRPEQPGKPEARRPEQKESRPRRPGRSPDPPSRSRRRVRPAAPAERGRPSAAAGPTTGEAAAETRAAKAAPPLRASDLFGGNRRPLCGRRFCEGGGPAREGFGSG